jgi:hypothetical protein
MNTHTTSLEADYLVIGSGAVGMAFADVILTESDASIIMVDRHHKPGGHWNHAYPFVRLHQPSEYYGVSSAELSKGRKDKTGLNMGMSNLASGAEVSAYFDDVMQHQFLPTGRVNYFPRCEYKGDGKFVSLVTGDVFEVKVKKKIVDAGYLETKVPATHTPSFKVAPEVQFIPINALPLLTSKPEGYVIIGGGKTGIDACLWLLQHHVHPDAIRWIVPRDPWLLDRKNLQPGGAFVEQFLRDRAAQLEALTHAESIADLFDRLEAAGSLQRVDNTVRPTMYRCATVSTMELEQLRRIKHIVRMGRVQRIEKDQIILDQGTIPTSVAQVHVDCSAGGLTDSKIKKVFAGNHITPQTVRTCQPAFSAAFIAHVEAAYDDENIKNEMCTVVPLPYRDVDWIRMMAVLMKNNYVWSQDSNLIQWLHSNRLEGGFLRAMTGQPDASNEVQELLSSIRNNGKPAMAKVQQFMSTLS